MTHPVPGPSPSAAAATDAVAEALHRLDDLADRPVAEHVEAFDAVHRSLQDALATLDEA